MPGPDDIRALCAASNAVLVVIDLQGKIFDMAFNSRQLRLLSDRVLQLANLFAVPVILTEHYPKGLGPTVPEIRQRYEELTTEKHLLTKTSFGCCGDASFNQLLTRVASCVREGRQLGDARAEPAGRPVDIVVAGIETHVCVQQTVLALLAEPGYRVVVLQDCVGGRIKANHEIALERFRQCGAVLSCFESLAFEWTRDKNDPRFKQMSALVKDL